MEYLRFDENLFDIDKLKNDSDYILKGIQSLSSVIEER